MFEVVKLVRISQTFPELSIKYSLKDVQERCCIANHEDSRADRLCASDGNLCCVVKIHIARA